MLVGELCIGDPELTPQFVIAAKRFETAVDLGVKPRDEEAGDRVDRGRIATVFDQPLESLQVSLDYLAVALQGEDQGDVDVLAGRDQILDRREASAGGRDLDIQIRPIDSGVKTKASAVLASWSSARLGSTSQET